MKKMISCLVLLSVLINCIQFARAFENSSVAENFADGIGIIDRNNYEKDKVITRAEFAKLLADLLRLNDQNAAQKEWEENNILEDVEEKIELDLSLRKFDDVDVSHKYYSQIIAVCQKGYMKGVSEKLFAPEYDIVMSDAVRVFINMLGYAEMAKLNSGIASTIGLTDGITTKMNEPAKMSDVIKLIHNALDINVLEMKFNGTDVSYETSDETFMTAVLKMNKVKGIMTDNGFTSIKGESSLTEGQVQVGNVVANTSESTEYVKDFIGHKVEMYYYIEDDEYEVQYAEIARDDESISFDICDFEKFENGNISYFNGNRSINKKLTANVYMIYNGEAKTVFDESVFDFQSGDVTLIDTEGKGYNLIVVTRYEFAVVSSRNVNEGAIYNKIKVPLSDLNKIDCSEDGTYESVIIKDTAENILSLSDIAQNDVLNILRNSKKIIITVSKGKVEGFKVKGSETDDCGRLIIADEEKKHVVADDYENSSDKIDFLLGNTYVIYLNMFDKVVWAEQYAGGENVGILTRVKYVEEDEHFRELRIYTSGGKLEKINAAEKIKVNGKNQKFENAVTELEDYYGKAVMYILDKEGILTEITTPEPFGTWGDRGWYEIAPEDVYQNGSFSMMMVKSDKTFMFTVPKDTAEYGNEKAFSTNYVFPENGTTTLAGYAKDKYSIVPDYMVIKTETATSGPVSVNSKVFVIDTISKGLNADDEVMNVIEGWEFDVVPYTSTLTYTKYSISEDCIMVDQINGNEIPSDADVKISGPRKVSELEKGDIIRYAKDANGDIGRIRIAYDCSTGSYFNTGDGGSGSDISITGQYKGGTGGSTWAGYPIMKSGTGVRMTGGTDILPSGVDLTSFEEVKNKTWTFDVVLPGRILVVEQTGRGKLNMYKGSMDDLTTYQDALKNKETDIMVVITEWSKTMKGTVIYKNFDLTE